MVQLLWFVHVLLETPQCIQVLLVHSLAATQFSLTSTVTVNAESVDGPTPAARVTWNTTLPSQCVASVRVEFRTGSHDGPLVANYTTTNTAETEIIQTGLRCTTNYFITVVVTGAVSGGVHVMKSSRAVEVLVGGKKIVYMRFNWYSSLMVVIVFHDRYTYSSWSES